MMNDNGGPAFPQPNRSIAPEIVGRGMTLRDYFAAKALQGMLADSKLQMSHKNYSNFAYELADAMLESRK